MTATAKSSRADFTCDSDSSISTIRLSFNQSLDMIVEKPKSAPFIKGPIPLDWMTQAAHLPGKALHVALAIRYLHGMNGDNSFKLTARTLKAFHISADATNDALKRLEHVGLIRLERKPGQRALITVNNVLDER